MKLKTIAKLFGAVVEDDYSGSPELPGWFRWYLDHMPVRENVYGTLIDLGLNGTQANIIIERIWPQVATIQQEAIALAKAGNESGAIAKLNEAASLAERLARETADERLLGMGIESEPSRAMEERSMAEQYGAEKGPFDFAWINNAARQIFEGLFQGNLPAEARQAFEAFLNKDLREAWRIEDNKGTDYPAETMEWLPNALYELAGRYGANVGVAYKIGDQVAKTDWPRQVVERDNYILINDYLGAGFAQAHPELVEELMRIAADYLAARPDVTFDNLWAYAYDALKKMHPAPRRGIEIGGSVMKADPIKKMFGARERLQTALPDGEMPIRRSTVTPGRIHPLPEKKDWPSEVVERDRYIIINDWMGVGFAEAHPELVKVLKEAAASYLAIHPDIEFDDLGAYVYEVLKTIYPSKKSTKTKDEKTGGGVMKLLSLRSILMAAASLGDLLSLLRKVKDPDKEVTAAIKKLEGMVAKYDEGAKVEDVGTAAMKRILTQLKKTPKPTEDRPRTRVLKAIKLLEDLLKTKVGSAVLQASIVQVARILKAVDEPTEEVKDAVKLADQLAKSYEEGGPKKYGKVVSVEGMTKLLKILEAIEEKPDPVVKAVAVLKKLLGAEEEKPVTPGERGALPSYGLAKLETALKPGVYRARLIRAGEALDGTTWPEDQLKAAFEKGYFEGVPVNAISYTGNYGPDIEYHLPLDTEIAGKVVGNQVGFIKDAKWDDEEHAGYGFVYITEAERRNLIDAMLEQGLDAPGMSIYADGMKDENDIVTGINGVTSMDLVTFPAADGAILSQALTASVKEWGALRKKLQAGEPTVAAATSDAGGTEVGAAAAKRTPKQHFGRIYSKTVAISKKYLAEWIDELHGYVFEGELADTKENHAAIQAEIDKIIQTLTKSTYSKTEADRVWGTAEKALWRVADRLWEAQEGKQAKTGGGIMSPTALEQRLDVVEKISQGLNERVVQADVDGMIEMKLQASKLPEKVQTALRGQLLGKQLTEEEVDSFIKFQQGITDDLAVDVAENAHVTLDGAILPGEGKDTLKGALTALFEKQS